MIIIKETTKCGKCAREAVILAALRVPDPVPGHKKDMLLVNYRCELGHNFTETIKGLPRSQ